MTDFKIESDDLTIGTVFRDFYAVPDFQREFVWQGQEVEKLLEDVLLEFYDEHRRLIEGPEYFLGSVVVYRDGKGIFQLIDGQQRMTTIYLVLCAARDALVEAGDQPPRVLKSQISDASSDLITGEDIFRYRLTLQYEDSDGVLEKIADPEIKIETIKETTGSVRRILEAYRTIREFLAVNLKNEPAEIKKFVMAFTTRIKMIRILTPTIANALKVFETINDRGVGLNAMDLLKNLLFMKTRQEEYPKLKERWKVLVDILDKCGEKPLRFLRYYILSHYETDYHKGLREDEIYDWFDKKKEAIGLAKDPLRFLNDLIDCAKAYAHFLGSRDAHGSENRYLHNLSILGRTLRQQNILLLAGRNLPEPLFSKLCAAIENLIFCYLVTREPTKNFERNFARWAGELREVREEQQLDAFLEEHFRKDMQSRSGNFDFAFRELTQGSIQKYRMRYVLAKLTQYFEEAAWGNPTYERLDMYTAKTVDVEHILPQNPQEDVRNAFDRSDEYDDYMGRFGNLTLLEKTINASISNAAYEDKLPGFRQSSFLLTKSLAELPQIGTNTALNRAVEGLQVFDHWNSETIEARQMMLGALARKVWDMPME